MQLDTIDRSDTSANNQQVEEKQQRDEKVGAFFSHEDLSALNRQFHDSKPSDIVRFSIEKASKPVVFTNFRPLAVAFLHLLTQVDKNLTVVWVDHGFNTAETYRHIDKVVDLLSLNLHVYSPKISAAHYLAVHGDIPPVDTPQHDEFTQLVKLDPFARAMQEIQPDVWFNGIRHDQNPHRKTLDIFTHGSHDTVRVAPMFHLTELDVDEYIYNQGLPDNHDYFDPTKVSEDRECGLLLQR